ncbi:hypothetical protein N6H18_10470 [Reichenbachiella agarivorans]|uniref:tRNA (Guanine-N1)-methyltransferase n=1 Tax=Reichenbachiella agarivorans TaxID=2979464 RepID=A0ABY6CJT0_9BACT|nr:hypothetical protein [Reichenbachiella agarivorans]UXP30776.1 hypothetical protein N6H18_10470 [Reichenbachiella agarivorans]
MIRIIAIAGLLFCVTHTSSFAQETIDEQFQEFYDNNTSSWQEYKLIKRPLLKQFWDVVSDTVKVKNDEIVKLKGEIKELDKQISVLKGQLSKTEKELTESNAVNQSILFLGIEMNKVSYNIMVWLIILGLVIAVLIIYFMYIRSNKVTTDSRKLHSQIEEELRDHKEKAREAQMKLKRELQTALNTIHENRLNH